MDIYPDMIGEGEAVIGYTMDGNDVAFPYTAEVPYRGSYEKYRASEIGLDPIIVRGRKALDESMATQAWIGKGFHGDVTDGHECNSTLVMVAFASDVTDIGDYALAGCSALTKIVIPKTVTGIGKGAFMGCVKLAEVSLPAGISEIRNDTFGFTPALKYISLPDSVKTIGECAFRGSGISYIDMPAALEVIGSRSFADCRNLEAIIIPFDVHSIAEDAFRNSEALTCIGLDYPVNNLIRRGMIPETCGVYCKTLK